MRNNDGVCLEWFEVAQELHLGRVLSRLLFGIYFTKLLLVSLQGFSEDLGVLTDLVRRQEQPATGSHITELKWVRRIV